MPGCTARRASQQHPHIVVLTPDKSSSKRFSVMLGPVVTHTPLAQRGTIRMPKRYNAPPAMHIDANKTYVAHFTTSRGEFDIQLFAKEAPVTVNNFVFLARDGF